MDGYRIRILRDFKPVHYIARTTEALHNSPQPPHDFLID